MKIRIPSHLNKPLVLLVIILAPRLLPAQTPDTLPHKQYRVWLKEKKHEKISSGYLWALSDSTLTLGSSPRNSSQDLQTYPIESVKWLKYRNRKSILRGAGRGAIWGFAAGFLVGLLDTPDDNPCKEGATFCYHFNFPSPRRGALYGLVGAPVGALIGVAVGSSRIRINIEGDRRSYEQQRKQLEQIRRRQ